VEQACNVSSHDERAKGVPAGRRIPTLLSVAALAIGGFGVAACGDEDSAGPESGGADVVEQEPEEGAAGHLLEVTLSELVETPNAYIGQVVTVSGRVADQEADRDEASKAAFTLGEDVDDDVLVLPTVGVIAEGITDAGVVRVKGTVHQVEDALADQEELLYEQDGVDDEFLDNFQDEVAIVATEIDTNLSGGDDAGEVETE
jgi:hypothetical protein